MNPSLSVSVMHAAFDPERVEMLRDVEGRLGVREAGFRGFLRSYSVVRDKERRGVWWAASRAWEKSNSATGMGAVPRGPVVPTSRQTHHLVLQDDFVPCRDFLAGLEKILRLILAAGLADSALSLFSPSPVSWECRRRSVSWHASLDGAWGGCVVLPTRHARAFVPWCRANLVESERLDHQDDAKIALYCMAHGLRFLHASPGLLRHAGVGRSVAGNDGARADRFRGGQWILGDDGSALDVDWAAGLASPIDAGVTWDHRALLWTSMRPERRASVDWDRLLDQVVSGYMPPDSPGRTS